MWRILSLLLVLCCFTSCVDDVKLNVKHDEDGGIEGSIELELDK